MYIPNGLKRGVIATLTAGLFAVGCGGRGCARTPAVQRLEDPYDRALVVMTLTDDSTYALRTRDYNGSDMGAVVGYDVDGDKSIEAHEQLTLVFNDQDKAYVQALLTGTKEQIDLKLTPLWRVKRPEQNRGSNQTSVGNAPYPVMVVNLPDGRQIWRVTPSYVDLFERDVWPVDSSGTESERLHGTINRQSEMPRPYDRRRAVEEFYKSAQPPQPPQPPQPAAQPQSVAPARPPEQKQIPGPPPPSRQAEQPPRKK